MNIDDILKAKFNHEDVSMFGACGTKNEDLRPVVMNAICEFDKNTEIIESIYNNEKHGLSARLLGVFLAGHILSEIRHNPKLKLEIDFFKFVSKTKKMFGYDK